MSSNENPTLYGYYRSTASYRVRIAANLKGIEVNHKPVHLRKGEQSEQAFLKINTAGLVPVWADRGFRLTQSLAIIAFLDEFVPNPPLLPNDARSRATCREIAEIICGDIHPIGNLRVLNYLSRLGINEEQRSDWSRHWIRLGFEVIEEKLADTSGPLSFGSEPTVADICIVPQVFNARRFGVDLTAYKRISQVCEAAAKLEAFAAAAPDRQIDAE